MKRKKPFPAQIIRTPSCEEMVILAKRDYDALVSIVQKVEGSGCDPKHDRRAGLADLSHAAGSRPEFHNVVSADVLHGLIQDNMASIAKGRTVLVIARNLGGACGTLTGALLLILRNGSLPVGISRSSNVRRGRANFYGVCTYRCHPAGTICY